MIFVKKEVTAVVWEWVWEWVWEYCFLQNRPESEVQKGMGQMTFCNGIKTAAIWTCYPFLEWLPKKWTLRFKLAGWFLLSDWQKMQRELYFNPTDVQFLDLTPQQIKEHFAELDSVSQEVAQNFIRKCKVHTMTQTMLAYPSVLILDTEKILTLRQLGIRARRHRDLAVLRQKYQVDGNYESLVCHHGLPQLPDSAKKVMAGKDFIDAGAYQGDSCVILAEYGPRRIWAFEPSPANLTELHRTMQNNNIPKTRYETVASGLAATTGTCFFHDCGNNGTDLKITGESQTAVTTLDAFSADHDLTVGLIKADVEGMGLEVVRGAEKTIKRDRPVLALAIYHNQDEFLRVYSLLKSWQLNYVFKMLDFPPHSECEITLLAYPEPVK